jgi:hypothetical protein
MGIPLTFTRHDDDTTMTASGEITGINTHTTVRGIRTMPWSRRSIAVRNRLRLALTRYKKPEQLQAVTMPLSPQEMDNATLVVLAQLGANSYLVLL